jgi:hypothetical protein
VAPTQATALERGRAPSERRKDTRWSWLSVRILVHVLTLLAAGRARADHKEIYTVLGFDAGVNRYNLPANGSGSTTAYAGALDLSVYYGLTNALHVGGRLRVSSTSNIHFSGVTLTMPDGGQSVGDVYADHRSIGLGALALYRVDTGRALAPLVEVEAGFTAHEYRRIEHVPAGVAYKIELPNASQTALHGSLAALLEYRFANRWVAMAGLTAQAESGNLQPWSLSVPLRLGMIW